MHEAAIFAAQQILEQDAQREGELRQVGDALLFEKFEPVNVKSLRADMKFVACAERVARVDGHPRRPFSVIRSHL